MTNRRDLSSELRRALSDAADEIDRHSNDVAILRAVLDSMSEGVVVADSEGEFVLFNREAELVLGAGEKPGGPTTWTSAYGVFLPDGTPFPVEDYPLVRAARGECTDDVEQLIRNSSYPEGRSIRVSGRPWRAPDGRIMGGVVVFRDVTELQNAWAGLRAANAELEQRVAERTRELEATQAQLMQAQKLESLGQLCGGIAHDFNNLLTAITGHTELLLMRGRLDPDARESIEEVHRAGGRAAELTRQLLTFSRRQPIEPRPTDVNALMLGMERLLGRLIGEPVRLVFDLAENLPSVLVDAGQFEQIVLNLAINARDAMPDGGTLTIETSRVRITEQHVRRYLDAAPR